MSRKQDQSQTLGKRARFQTQSQSLGSVVLTKQTELKYQVKGTEAVVLYHNRGTVAAGSTTSNQGALVWNPWAFIQQGSSSQERVGSEIWPRGMSLTLHYKPYVDRVCTHLRVIVCTIPKVSNSIVSDGSNFNLMDATGGVPNNTLCSYRKDDNGIKVLYDKVFRVEAVSRGNINDGEARWYKKIFIQRSKSSKIIFERQNEIVNKPLAVYVLPYDKVSSLRTDAIGEIDCFYKLYFRDV